MKAALRGLVISILLSVTGPALAVACLGLVLMIGYGALYGSFADRESTCGTVGNSTPGGALHGALRHREVTSPPPAM